MEDVIARILARFHGHPAWWSLYIPGVRAYLNQQGSVPVAPNMSIFPNIIDDTVEIRIKITREWLLDATQEQKLESMFFFAQAWGAAVGLRNE